MRFNSTLLGALLLALVGCGGGDSDAIRAGGPNSQPVGASEQGDAAIELSTVKEGVNHRVNLHARGALDIYQIAGTLSFDGGRYSVVGIEAGGGLGGPEDAIFLCAESAPGRLDFAYTKRAYGPGVSGDAWLLSVLVEPQAGAFSLGDFSLAEGPGKLLVRDGRKQALSVSVARGGVK
jgi:hypothetical protein